MIIYHYCLVRQITGGVLEYLHGAVRLTKPIETLDEYKEVIKGLIKEETQGWTVLSLNRL